MFKEYVDGAPLTPCDHPQSARRVVTPNASHTQEMPARSLPTPARVRHFEYCDQCEHFLAEVRAAALAQVPPKDPDKAVEKWRSLKK